MPIPDDYRDLVTGLITKTEAGKLSWFPDESQFAVVVDGTKILLWGGIDERSEEPFIAFGLSSHDARFNRLAAKMIDSWFVDESDADYGEVYSLFKSAQRHANGIPSLIKKLTIHLTEDDDSSGPK